MKKIIFMGSIFVALILFGCNRPSRNQLIRADRECDSDYVNMTESRNEFKHRIKFAVYYSENNIDTLVFQSDLKILYWCGRGTSYVQEEQRPFTRTHAPLFQTTAPIKVLENK